MMPNLFQTGKAVMKGLSGAAYAAYTSLSSSSEPSLMENTIEAVGKKVLTEPATVSNTLNAAEAVTTAAAQQGWSSLVTLFTRIEAGIGGLSFIDGQLPAQAQGWLSAPWRWQWKILGNGAGHMGATALEGAAHGVKNAGSEGLDRVKQVFLSTAPASIAPTDTSQPNGLLNIAFRNMGSKYDDLPSPGVLVGPDWNLSLGITGTLVSTLLYLDAHKAGWRTQGGMIRIAFATSALAMGIWNFAQMGQAE